MGVALWSLRHLRKVGAYVEEITGNILLMTHERVMCFCLGRYLYFNTLFKDSLPMALFVSTAAWLGQVKDA